VKINAQDNEEKFKVAKMFLSFYSNVPAKLLFVYEFGTNGEFGGIDTDRSQQMRKKFKVLTANARKSPLERLPKEVLQAQCQEISRKRFEAIGRGRVASNIQNVIKCSPTARQLSLRELSETNQLKAEFATTRKKQVEMNTKVRRWFQVKRQEISQVLGVFHEQKRQEHEKLQRRCATWLSTLSFLELTGVLWRRYRKRRREVALLRKFTDAWHSRLMSLKGPTRGLRGTTEIAQYVLV
jgi:hypothetical protein